MPLITIDEAPAAGASARPPAQPARAGRIQHPRSDRIGNVVSHFVMIVLGLFALVPVFWMVFGSLRSPASIFAATPPIHPDLANYHDALSNLPWSQLLFNTVTMALGVSVGQLLTGLLAAYAFSCWKFRGERALFLLIVATWLVPLQVTILPNYVLLAHLGLLNSVAGVVLPQISYAYAILLLRQHIKGFPKELLEAARLDGRSSWSILWRVIVPSIGPALAALGILLFVNAWNEYFWPLVVFNEPGSVLQIGIGNFLNADAADYGGLMAASSLATLPILVLYLILRRRVVNAFARSGMRYPRRRWRLAPSGAYPRGHSSPGR
jgi:multiple sugar transport system permease protein